MRRSRPARPHPGRGALRRAGEMSELFARDFLGPEREASRDLHGPVLFRFGIAHREGDRPANHGEGLALAVGVPATVGPRIRAASARVLGIDRRATAPAAEQQVDR